MHTISLLYGIFGLLCFASLTPLVWRLLFDIKKMFHFFFYNF